MVIISIGQVLTIRIHYLTLLLAGLNLSILAWLLLRFSKFRKRDIPALRYCLLILLTSIVFSIVAIGALLLPQGAALLHCATLMTMSSLFVNTFFTLLIFNLIENKGSWFYRYQKILLVVLAVLTPLYLTNGWHHWIVEEIQKHPDGFSFEVTNGPALIIFSSYSFLLTALAVIMALRSRKKGLLQNKWIRWALVMGTLLPALFTVLENAVPFLAELQLVLVSTWVSVALICNLFFGYLLTARNTALDLVNDVYVAFDLNQHCVDVNREGIEFFSRYCGVEQPTIEHVCQLFEIVDISSYTGGEARLRSDSEYNYYRISTFPLSSSLNQHCGNGYIIREITEFVDRMSHLSTIADEDPLTGAKNRRYLSEASPTILDRAEKKQTPLTTLMLDIDHFKNINDSYGHVIGDAILIELHRILQNNVRENDFVVRYGGEEFLILYENMNQAQGLLKAERIRANVEAYPFPTDAGTIHITVSIGVFTKLPGAKDVMEQYIERADEQLYMAKENGRNQVR